MNMGNTPILTSTTLSANNSSLVNVGYLNNELANNVSNRILENA